jgi:CRP-like cAMP-binding protein
VFVALEGAVELRARPPGRRAYRTLEVVGGGCTFGDEALFDADEYLFSARTMEASRLISLDRDGFDELAQARPDIAVGLARCSGSCLTQTVRRSAILTQAPAEVGLQRLLHDLATSGGSPDGNGAVPVRVTHAQLAGLLHLSRETVSRMLSRLAADGEVEVGRGVVRIPAASIRPG